MKRLLLGTALLALVVVVPIPTIAGVDIHIGVPLPPPPPIVFPAPPSIVFHAPPEVIVLPDTDGVYVAPAINVDLFFWNGWWQRPYEGRWYRSRYYDRGWGYYKDVPSFYFDVDPGWRGHYRNRHWRGHRWNYSRIPEQELHRNWKSWQKDQHWERHGTWGVENYRDRPKPHEREELRHQRHQEYQQRAEVQQHQQGRQQQERQMEHRSGEGGEYRGKEGREYRGREGREDKGKGRNNDQILRYFTGSPTCRTSQLKRQGHSALPFSFVSFGKKKIPS